MPKPTGGVKVLRVGVNYPGSDGVDVRKEAGDSLDTTTLPSKVLKALDDMEVWVTDDDEPVAPDDPPDPDLTPDPAHPDPTPATDPTPDPDPEVV